MQETEAFREGEAVKASRIPAIEKGGRKNSRPSYQDEESRPSQGRFP
jgi:hypothetical protein